MMKKIISFIAVLGIVFTAFVPGMGTVHGVFAADTDTVIDTALIGSDLTDGSDSDVMLSEETDVNISIISEDFLLPTGGVDPIIGIGTELDEDYDPPKDSENELLEIKGIKGRTLNSADPEANNGAGTYAYDRLSDVQKYIYNSFSNAVASFRGSDKYREDLNDENGSVICEITFEEDQKCNADDISYALTGYLMDNPQNYYLINYYSYRYKTDWSYVKITWELDDYYYSYKNRQEADRDIENIGSVWVEELQDIIENNKEDGEYLAAVRAHDLIIDRINYTYIPGTTDPQTAKWAHSIAGVFTGQGAVCDGYARTYQYLLNKCGIENVYIVGVTQKNDPKAGHAWNAVKFGEEWCLIDVTWDDCGKESTGSNDMYYSFFAIPQNEFKKMHIPDEAGDSGMYELPSFSSSDQHTYYKYFNGYANGSLTDAASAQAVYDAAASKKPDFTTYLYFSAADSDELSIMSQLIGRFSAYSSSYFGYVFRIEYTDDIENPATEITLTPDKLSIEIDATGEITAEIAEDSDDRILFTLDENKYCSIVSKGKTATITGKKNGKAVVTAKTVKGKAVATCEVTIGTGIPDPDDINVWQNGGKDYKKIKLEPSITATNWKDSKGKTKAGKLVWLASDEDINIEFDREKHKVETKIKPTKGSVSNKGVVTAKTAGRLYVYCCDTGSFDVERFVVEVLASPSKLLLGSTSGVTESKDALKKLNLNAGETGRVYVCPFVKDGTADEANQYTVTVAKPEQAQYVSVSKVKMSSKGAIYFDVSALNFDQAKNKPATVKLVIQCVQSGKKASLTVVVCNPVTAVQTSDLQGKTTLAKKKDALTMKLDLQTCIEDISKTTDKLKIYVGNTSVALDSDGKKVIADKGATVKAKFDAKTMKLTLTAGQDAGQTALVYLGANNSQTKKTALFPILTVGADGTVNLTAK
ncbi:MAG: hypothetical protein J6Y89_02630 [Lachnospiraceae bacterium]|nr:hypothetical protein [Lachnospiraceae bacterium]